jgi:uncharacterized protein (DUF2237 family)
VDVLAGGRAAALNRARAIIPVVLLSRAMSTARNVLGEPLAACCFDPLTGYFRTGSCVTDASDAGSHVICARVTPEFLAFSLSRGNDLVTPAPQYRFRGLKPGDRWCLCALRWREALEAGVAPPVVLAATHERALRFVSLDQLRSHALDGA